MDHERERESAEEPQVLEGEDDVPRQPLDRDSAPDAYEAEAIPTEKARKALRLALVVIAAVVALVVVLALLD